MTNDPRRPERARAGDEVRPGETRGDEAPPRDDARREAASPALPPDPDAYDSPRAVQARARGLQAPYIAGGEDPDPDAARREERRNLRLLITMVIVIVLSGYVLGWLANVLDVAR